MDIVYLLREAPIAEEMRFSLRSLKNVPHDAVHIVGWKPSWVNNEVSFHPYNPGTPPANETHQKWWRTWRMMRYLCLLDEISEDFVLFNDDFYVMNPIDEVPVLHRGPIKDVVKKGKEVSKGKRNIYTSAMSETEGYLELLERGTLCYEVHAPIIINRHKMTTAMEIIEALKPKTIPIHVNKRSLYGNYWEIGGVEVDDSDIKVDSRSPKLTPRTFLSSSDHSFIHRGVRDHLKVAFPDRSPYENGARRR